ncbi:DNA-binding response regulator, LuxR family [Pseudonocardia sp. Ae168_Ps1]|uniref:response regulator transcription factor n=1 Tax=unclassified Pseudonocardia TaxID=2619320 RepID=UPI00094AFCEF|nr:MULTISPECIES: response regulator transcription factor [unclassified Pseudonocardia]OLL71408.1 DNA-binding response regulator, LuxR family [Pseudonocardia sp. Ae168_Ps1]OLL77045.1 DNA-binding response regulator, LuxR family [Pseudonocardia sp. Ae150A_Ps1]OLL88844.1 DNA-binding response regulator, LuxR family [Pseudonocardia sp. Ae263_Ps1]OLL91130.1 DNA-binding response regulator, LuxR family [Pseudonocardia sp. Ae356_Ps1]
MLVDDQELVRAGFAMVLDSCDDLTVVAQAGDGEQALAELDRTAVDVVLMDVRMPRLDGIEATRLALAAHPGLKVVVLTTFDLDESVTAAIGAGASGFLLKDVKPQGLIDAVRTVHSGDSVIDPVSTRRLLRATAPLLSAPEPAAAAPDAAAALADLTPREREVLNLVGDGRSNAEIQQDLVVSEATVKTHIGHLLAKTGSRDRVQLVALAFRAGLVS